MFLFCAFCGEFLNPSDRKNTVFNALGESIWGFQAALVAPATVLTVMLRDYGAGERMIGSIAAVESGAALLPQIIGIYLFTSHARRKMNLVLWHVLLMAPAMLAIALLTHFSDRIPPAVLRLAIIGCFGWFQFFMGIIVAVWMDWLAHLFAPAIRGTVFGISWCASAVAGTGSGLLAGYILKVYPHAAYTYLYLAAGVLVAVCMGSFAMIRDPAADQPDDRPRVTTADLLDSFRLSLLDRNFRAFIIGRVLTVAGFCIGPFIAIYYTSAAGGGLSNNAVVSFGAAMTVGMAVGNLGLGRLGDSCGHRIGILLGAAVQVAALIVMLVSAGRLSCMLAYFGAGLVGASGFLSHVNMLYETCPHDSRIAHITVANFLMGVTMIVCPIASGFAAAQWGLPTLFAICLAISVCAFVWLLLRLREPRELKTEVEEADSA